MAIQSENERKEGIIQPKKRKFKESLNEFKPIFLFLPLIFLIQSDDATLIVNQMQFLADFNLGAHFSYMGALSGVGQIVKAFATLSFGFFADKSSRKRLLIICGTIWALSDLLMAFSPSFVMVFIFRVVGSAFAGAAGSVVMSLLSDLFSSDNRGKSFAVWGFISTIGIALGTSIAGAFNTIDLAYPNDLVTLEDKINYLRFTYPVAISEWRYPFMVFGFLGLAFVLLAFFLKEPKRAAKERILQGVLAHEEVDYSKIYNIKFSDLKYIYVRKTNFWLIINFLDTFLTGLILTNIFTWIVGEMGFNLADLSLWWYIIPLALPILLGIIIGMIYWPIRGDKIVQKGDLTGRVRMAVTAGWVHLPFMITAFLFIPHAGRLTLFRDAVQATPLEFAFGCLAMGILAGIGLSLEMAVGPLHYSSMIDVNLPEHRSTMISAAAFIDAFGRALGSWIGLALVEYYDSTGSAFAISDAILFAVCTFAVGSGLMWLPIYKYAKKDLPEVARILTERKIELEKKLKEVTGTNQTNENQAPQ